MVFQYPQCPVRRTPRVLPGRRRVKPNLNLAVCTLVGKPPASAGLLLLVRPRQAILPSFVIEQSQHAEDLQLGMCLSIVIQSCQGISFSPGKPNFLPILIASQETPLRPRQCFLALPFIDKHLVINNRHNRWFSAQ